MQSTRPRVVSRPRAAVLGSLLLLAACQASPGSNPATPAAASLEGEARFAITPAASPPALQEVDETPAVPPATEKSTPSLAAPTGEQDAPVPAPPPPHPDLVYSPNLYRRWGINLGGAAFQNFQTNVRISTPVLLGASLSLEDTMGVTESSSSGRLDVFYNFNRRHGLELAYYDIRRDGERYIDEQLEIGGNIYGPGSVYSKFDTAILKLDYRYNFVADYRTTIAISAGFHVMRIDTAFKTKDGLIDIEETFKVTAPLPLVGLHAEYALSPKWKIGMHQEFMQASLEGYSGGIRDTLVSLDHDTFDHFGWGIGYNAFNLDLSVEKDSGIRGDIDYGYQGLMIYVRAFW